MAMTIKSSTAKHTNGATSTHHRVVIQHPSVLELDDINSVWVKESVSEGN